MRAAVTPLETFHAAGHGLPLWMIFQCVAALAAASWFAHRARGRYARLRLCLIVAFGGALAGATLLEALFRLPAWWGSGKPLPALFGGVTAYGALLGLSLSFAALARLRGVRPAEALDVLAPCLGVLVLFGRLGCFFAGCDFGAVSGVPWAVRFPPGSPAFTDHVARGLILAADHRSLPVHPTQIYEALLGALVALAALVAERRRLRPGLAFGSAAATYAAGRLIVDALRGDLEAARWGRFAPSQWLGAALLATMAIVLLRRKLLVIASSGRARSSER